ncbi:MAG: beta-ketoacyl-ACP synthase II [Burkholderiales bacterium]|jgi:3-oxoacyl-[acyl-carrier-protein] synthase II|nr:beta-ketoacyl-ACP synthase II [Burkholderiales bacterium]MCL4688679.1 beta-ketoacyl-ACP synthase II [Burkholderiales bacterium]
MSKRRVVVTGLGIVSPVGTGLPQAWENLVNGRSGVGPITKFDATPLSTRIAAEVKGFEPSQWMPPKEVRRSDTFIHYGIAATRMALDDAGLAIDEGNALRTGVIVGSGIGGLPMIEANILEMGAKGPRRISPFFVPGSIINMVAGLISIHFGAKGPNVSMVSACTTSSHCVGEAGRLIEYGDADIMIAGGTEATICMSGMGGFCSLKALSERNDDPATASRPFDRDRDGFVLGEGAGILILEEYEHAKRRGARIYAELAGMGMSADASHITAPDMDGPRRAMLAALRNGGLNADEVQYLNAHGTSTPLGDANETAAVKAAFGDHARRMAVNSTKSMHGHLLGAAGGVEALITVLAIHHQVSPPTINLSNPDPACDLDYVPNVAREMPIEVALSNSFGFGGTNGTLAFRRLR